MLLNLLCVISYFDISSRILNTMMFFLLLLLLGLVAGQQQTRDVRSLVAASAESQTSFLDVLQKSMCAEGVFLWGKTDRNKYMNITHKWEDDVSYQISPGQAHINTPNVHLLFENPTPDPFITQRCSTQTALMALDAQGVFQWYTALMTLISMYKDVKSVTFTDQCPGGHTLWIWNGEGSISAKHAPDTVITGYVTAHEHPRMCTSYAVELFKGGVNHVSHNRFCLKQALCFQTPRTDKAFFYFVEKPMVGPVKAKYTYDYSHIVSFTYNPRHCGKCSDDGRCPMYKIDCASSLAYKRACDAFPGCKFISYSEASELYPGCRPGEVSGNNPLLDIINDTPCKCQMGGHRSVPLTEKHVLPNSMMMDARTYICPQNIIYDMKYSTLPFAHNLSVTLDHPDGAPCKTVSQFASEWFDQTAKLNATFTDQERAEYKRRFKYRVIRHFIYTHKTNAHDELSQTNNPPSRTPLPPARGLVDDLDDYLGASSYVGDAVDADARLAAVADGLDTAQSRELTKLIAQSSDLVVNMNRHLSLPQYGSTTEPVPTTTHITTTPPSTTPPITIADMTTPPPDKATGTPSIGVPPTPPPPNCPTPLGGDAVTAPIEEGYFIQYPTSASTVQTKYPTATSTDNSDRLPETGATGGVNRPDVDVSNAPEVTDGSPDTSDEFEDTSSDESDEVSDTSDEVEDKSSEESDEVSDTSDESLEESYTGIDISFGVMLYVGIALGGGVALLLLSLACWQMVRTYQ